MLNYRIKTVFYVKFTRKSGVFSDVFFSRAAIVNLSKLSWKKRTKNQVIYVM